MKTNNRPIYLIMPIASILIGLFYALITHFNPFIYLNIIVLIVMAAFLFILVKEISQNGKIENKAFNFIYGLLIGLLAWIISWATYFVFQENDGFTKLFTQPSEFIQFIIDYAGHHKMSVGKGSSKIKMNETIMNLVYIVELLVFLAPAFATFKIKTKQKQPVE